MARHDFGEAFAVINDAQHHAFTNKLEPDDDFVRFAVLDGIGNGLLGYPVDMSSGRNRKFASGLGTFDTTDNTEHFLRIGGQFMESGEQAF